MENKTFCQSCTMPLDNNEIKGTEKDDSKSNEFCKYCYENGAFKSPDMTIDEMKEVVSTQMKKNNLPDYLINMSLSMLPGLKRWKSKTTVA